MIRNIFSAENEKTHDGTVKLHRLIRQGEINAQVATFNYAWLDENEALAEHSHQDSIEYFLILSGIGLVSLDGEDSSVSKGSLITILPEVVHSLKNTHSEVLAFITLRAILNE